MDIRFLGHACFELSDGDTRVLVDPFLTGNPKAAAQADELEPTHIFLTHGHADHYGDIVDIAKRTGAQVVAITHLILGHQEIPAIHRPGQWALYAVVLFAIVSAVDYFRTFWNQIDGRFKAQERQRTIVNQKRARRDVPTP